MLYSQIHEGIEPFLGVDSLEPVTPRTYNSRGFFCLKEGISQPIAGAIRRVGKTSDPRAAGSSPSPRPALKV